MEALGRLGAADLVTAMATYRDALQIHREVLNRMNVYPVPDGDTGTNMALTLESVVSELGLLEGPEMASVCKAIAHGSLMGARGNSGVILSQLLRGMTSVFSEAESTGPTELARGLRAASEAADRAVLRPVEGTILTVARAAAEGAEATASRGEEGRESGISLIEALESARFAADEALARTPELLPVLAQAGVVDAGGGGYVLLLDSLLNVVDGRALPEAPQLAAHPALEGHEVQSAPPYDGNRASQDREEGSSPARRQLGLRYEVMYFLEAPDDTIPAFKDVWEGIGDSIVVVGGDGIWNCHIHTDDVGAAVEAALDAGRPRRIRVSDLAEQVEEERWVREGAVATPDRSRERSGPPVRTAVVAVANGEGIGRIFHSLGVHNLVAGGQSMNPSTAQILDVVDDLSSEDVVILPNNENIIPVAMQVCELARKTVRVVPTCGIVEGFAALLEYDPEAGAEENVASMSASARRVVAGEVTQAIRDSKGPSGPIKAGDWMGLSRDGVEVVGSSMAEATCGLLGKLLSEEHELVTLIEGEGAQGAQTREITEWLAENQSGVAVEVHHGGQPLYPYLLSIE